MSPTKPSQTSPPITSIGVRSELSVLQNVLLEHILEEDSAKVAPWESLTALSVRQLCFASLAYLG